jgi:serine/threonine protein kinase
MERGQTLYSFLNQQRKAGSLNSSLLVRLLAGVINGLAYLHSEKGIVHNDIKPENVVVVGGIARLVDFGSACPIGQKVTSSTLAYSAP